MTKVSLEHSEKLSDKGKVSEEDRGERGGSEGV